jgi:glutathione S-transferase
MILYGSTLSPFVRKAIAFATEKGIEVELVPVRMQDENADFRAASPFGKMPALSDGEYRLSDSSAIVHYLEAKHPSPELIPSEPRARGRTIWFDEFADTILFGCGQKMFFNRIVAPRFLKRPGDEALADTAEREELPPILDYLESVVPEGAGYLMSKRLTLADISVASPFVNLIHLGIEVDPARWPRTRAYVDRMLARQSFAPWVAREAAILEKTAA